MVDGGILRQRASQVSEAVHSIYFLAVYQYVWLDIGLSWGRQVQSLSLLRADCKSVIGTSNRKVADTTLQVGLRVSIYGAVVCKQEVEDGVWLVLVLALNLLGLKS